MSPQPLPSAEQLQRQLAASQDRVQTLHDLLSPPEQASQALERLLLREAHYQTLFETANDAILVLADGLILDCNPRALQTFAATREGLVGCSLADLSPAEQQEGQASPSLASERLARAQHGEPQFFDWRFQRLDGGTFEAEVNLNRLVLSGQDYLLAVGRDISGRKRTEESLRASEERFRSLSQNAPDIIYTLDQEEALTYVNPA